MKFNIKTYKLLKTKLIFQKSNCFFLYNTIIQKNNPIATRDLTKIILIHYKLFNALTKLIFQNSMYKKYTSLISGLLIIIFPKTYKILPYLNNVFTLLGIKINNKVYSNVQIKYCNTFCYNKNVLQLIRTLKISLKFFNFFLILDKNSK